MSEGQVVTIFDNYVEMTIDGINKLLSVDDFKTVFDKIMNSDVKIDPILLPRNVIMFGKGSNSIQLNTYWPSIEATLKVGIDNKPKDFKIKMPNIILFFNLAINNVGTYQVNTCKYFSTPKLPGELTTKMDDMGFIKDVDVKNKIYPLALPNMYHDGRACYGNNSMPSGFKSDLRGLDWYYLFLRETPFNCDLSIPGVVSPYTSVSTYMEFLTKEKEFPFETVFRK